MNLKGNNCGYPPIPLGADVTTDVISGQTTLVTYTCQPPLSLNPTGPQESFCDPRTGDWSPLPRCTGSRSLATVDYINLNPILVQGFLHWEDWDPPSNKTSNTENLGSDSPISEFMISSVTVICVIVLILIFVLIPRRRER